MPGRWFTIALQVAHPGSSSATIGHACSASLPKNTVIRRIWMSHSGDATVQGGGRVDFVLTDDGLPPANVAPIGPSIFGPISPGGSTVRIDGGGASTDLPYYSNAQGLAILEPHYLVDVPGKFLVMTVRKSIVSIFNVAALVSCEQLDVPETGVGEAILPRGTEAEPVCVRICPGEGAPLPPPPPPPAPPPAPVVTVVGALDPLAEPLPLGTLIEPAAPLAAARGIVGTTRVVPE